MTENEKLRALLAEARDGLFDPDISHDVVGCNCGVCTLARRIDAALAEPLRTMSEDAISREAMLENERDEARAEVERFKKHFDDRWYECHDGSEQACCKSHE